MPVYIIRHCLKEQDRKRFPDDDLTPLSPAGLAQIPELGAELRKLIDENGHNGKVVLLSSPQLRSEQTSGGIMNHLQGLNIEGGFDARLKEISRGTYYALNEEERMKKGGEAMWRSNMLKNMPGKHGMLIAKTPDGEDIYDVFRRTRDLVQGVKKKYTPQDTIILVTSNCPARLLAMDFTGQSLNWYLKEATPNSGSIRKLSGESWNAMQDEGYVYEGKSQKLSQLERIGQAEQTSLIKQQMQGEHPQGKTPG